MNNDMKCPFCQQEIMCMDVQDTDEYSTWYCPRCIAEKAWYAFGNKTLWQELIRTRKTLEQSETCCTEWEKQALDYKAENIGLQSKLDIAVAFIKELDGTRSGSRENLHAYNGKTLNAGNGFCWATIDQIHNILRQINHKEEK